MAGYTLVTERANEALNLEDVKLHLRVDQDADDNLIEATMAAVRDHVETVTNRTMIQRTFDLVLDDFPASSNDPIYILRTPLVSVTSITYTDSNGDSQTWGSANYIVDTSSEPPRVAPAYGVSYPATRDIVNAVTVRFIAGYGTSGDAIPTDVPAALRQAMLLMIGTLYENRESIVVGTITAKIPDAFDALLAPYKVEHFG
jgi:uncharacterized phiE125 gp8 family phage protein